MYTRQPDSKRSPMKIPENYSGHAFKAPSPYSDMPPPTHLPIPQSDWREDVTEGRSPSHTDDIIDETGPVESTLHSENSESTMLDTAKKQDSRAASIFSSLLPSSILNGNHFPFGHGIGSEEILILAIMLLVYLSGEEKGEPDTEFLLMLGLLLFAG